MALVLVYRTGGFGDHIIGLPCLHLVARQFPGDRRILIANSPSNSKVPSATEIFAGSGLFEDILLVPRHPMKHPMEMARLHRRITRLGASTLVYLPCLPAEIPVDIPKRIFRDIAFFYLAGVRNFIGLPARGNLNRLKLPSGSWEPERDRLARMLSGIGKVDYSSKNNWDLRLTDEEKDWGSSQVRSLGDRPVLAISISSSIQAKDWTLERWVALMPGLRKAFPSHALIAVGAALDYQPSQSVLSSWEGPHLNLCGLASPRQTAAALGKCDIFFGVDSGPMHLAASLGVPCVIVFSARAPKGIWFPYGERHEILYTETSCSNCGLDVCITENRRCLLSIMPGDVIAAALRIKASMNH